MVRLNGGQPEWAVGSWDQRPTLPWERKFFAGREGNRLGFFSTLTSHPFSFSHHHQQSSQHHRHKTKKLPIMSLVGGEKCEYTSLDNLAHLDDAWTSLPPKFEDGAGRRHLEERTRLDMKITRHQRRILTFTCSQLPVRTYTIIDSHCTASAQSSGIRISNIAL